MVERAGACGGADGVVAGIQGECQIGADRFCGEAADGGFDAAGADRHARGRNADAFDEEQDGAHEVVVVEKGLAHTHEDQVQTVASDPGLVAAQHRDFTLANPNRARALIASSIFHRYSGDEDFPPDMALSELLDKDDGRHALRLGLTWRFAFSLSASAAGELAHYRLRMPPAKIVLEVPRKREAIASEPVQKRLGALAESFDRRGEILVG